ncbi:hypothetical protein Y5S_00730 [Alcanivorax nanhaiticus]|uniref:Permuted papain-like amidase YaeF/Yiix C92 family enzyme n=1 Tax=Alcanivorax nanhaiticus TaxID=1177154 RepID=A0A095TV48_9GAMM|nr:hypothetical protein [Alcanivorax nanhaiticus]KGD66258.1 hypothetical protein Y5S_00730 [Alcanivorax nanhaiticus]
MTLTLDSAFTLRTGDILLFSGRGFTSEVIRVFTRSPWSHIGMVVFLPESREPLVLESTTLGESVDVRLGKPVAGVSLVSLSTKLKDYPGSVVLRRRHGPDLSDSQEKLLQRLLRRLMHRPYKNYLLCNAIDVLTAYQRKPDQRGWFCSELVAELYRRLGWLPRDTRSSTLVPGHFGSRHMRLLNGKLGQAQWLKRGKGCEQLKASAGFCDSNPATPRQIFRNERLLPLQSHGNE